MINLTHTTRADLLKDAVMRDDIGNHRASRSYCVYLSAPEGEAFLAAEQGHPSAVTLYKVIRRTEDRRSNHRVLAKTLSGDIARVSPACVGRLWCIRQPVCIISRMITTFLAPHRYSKPAILILLSSLSASGGTSPTNSARESHILPINVLIRTSKYLNKVIEQDHRRVKQRANPMLGFKQFGNASVTISGVELAHKIKKGQFDTSGVDEAECERSSFGKQCWLHKINHNTLIARPLLIFAPEPSGLRLL